MYTIRYYSDMREVTVYICDPFWENLPICADNFFPDLLIKEKISVTSYLSYGASFDATLAVVLTRYVAT